jgi:hypothetical protein
MQKLFLRITWYQLRRCAYSLQKLTVNACRLQSGSKQRITLTQNVACDKSFRTKHNFLTKAQTVEMNGRSPAVQPGPPLLISRNSLPRL